jgi:hypothetical protein
VALTGLPTPAVGVIKTVDAKIDHSWTFDGDPVLGIVGVGVEVRILAAPFNPYDIGIYLGQAGGRLTPLDGNHSGEEAIVAQPGEGRDLIGVNLSDLVGGYIFINLSVVGDNITFPAYVLNSIKFTLTLE